MHTVSAMLSVFYDGQYYSAVFEARDEGGCRAARKVFAVPPSGPGSMRWCCGNTRRWISATRCRPQEGLRPPRRTPNAGSAKPRRHRNIQSHPHARRLRLKRSVRRRARRRDCAGRRTGRCVLRRSSLYARKRKKKNIKGIEHPPSLPSYRHVHG